MQPTSSTPLLIPELVTGVLKGYDQLLNLVLDEVQEILQTGGCPSATRTRKTAHTRSRLHFDLLPPVPEGEPAVRNLGLVVLRGPTITLLSPVDGFEEIANPFMAQE